MSSRVEGEPDIVTEAVRQLPVADLELPTLIAEEVLKLQAVLVQGPTA